MTGADRTAVALGAGALLVAGLALAAGAVDAPGRIGVAELTEELASGAPAVTPLELASWIRARRPVRVVDVRDSGDFVRFSIPTAEHVAMDALATIAGSTEAIVVYDDGSGRAAHAWLLLRRLGRHRVHLLTGGVAGWIRDVVNPVLPAGTPEERARFEEVAEVSRYFGGVPKIGTPAEPTAGGRAETEAAIRLLSRRGCY